MNTQKIKSLLKKNAKALINLLTEDPSPELFVALHRLCIKYMINPHHPRAHRFFFQLTIYDPSQISEEFRPHFEILLDTLYYVKKYDKYELFIKSESNREPFRYNKKVMQLLKYLSENGSVRTTEVQHMLGTVSGFQRIIEQCIDNKLIHVYESDLLPSLVSITYKGRRVLIGSLMESE